MKKMKKIVLFIAMLFIMACSSTPKDITQRVAFDNIKNNYTVTTYFNYPYKYSSYVYCLENQIDSVKIAELDKAEDVQEDMIKKMN
jgi:hypothetical protein